MTGPRDDEPAIQLDRHPRPGARDETSTGVDGRHGRITTAAVAELRRLIGVPIVDSVEPWCYEITRDNIRHYAHGIGDDNPLWCDPSYAEKSKHGNLLAPPSFVFALSRVLSGYVGGLPGVHAMWAGADLRWDGHLHRGAEVRVTAQLDDLIEHETRFAGRAIQQVYAVEIEDLEGRRLCSGKSWCFRTERDTARVSGTKYTDTASRATEKYDISALREIYDLYDAEVVRGIQPRYFEDVEVGSALPTMAKGPMTITGFIAFAQGWGGLYIRANKLAYRQIRQHTSLGVANHLGIPDVPERVHWEREFAVEVGAPGAYDYGPERFSWMTHQITNWMGDDGLLRRQQGQIHLHNVAGDWLRIDATVASKQIDHLGRALVTIDQQARNQHGELSATGRATIQLPVRSHGR